MQHNEFISIEIKKLLQAGGKCDESDANTAVAHAMEYRRTHPSAPLQVLIDEAKFHLKHNRRPATPPRTEPIKKAALPKRRQFS